MQDFINLTLGDFLDDMARRFPDNEALVYPDRNLRLTYKQFNNTCREIAKGMLAMGVKKGDHVSIWATNYPEWACLIFAAAKIGAILVTVNTSYKIFELEYLLRQSDTKTLFFAKGFKDSDYVSIINELLPEIDKGGKSVGLSSERLPVLENVVYIPKSGEKLPDNFSIWSEMVEKGKDISDAELDSIQASISPHDVTNMQYTSGTTGFPKGVMLTHYNIINNGKTIGDNMKFTEKDRLCICVPFFHCFGLVLAIMASVTHGTTMVPVEVYSPLAVLDTISKEHCTAVHGVPSMFIFMLEHPDFKKYDVSSLRTGIMAGSPCPIKVMRQVVDEMNMKEIVIVFGQTECSPGMTMSSTDDPLELRVSTVGRLFPGVEGKIIDPETGNEVPPNVPGEICTRGYHVMRGYYNMPEATRNAIDTDGWLHTGDIGVVDEAGYYKITGRLKDMIIRGGENIYPREIEELLYTNGKIQDVQVVGIPSKKYGEEVMAYIIMKEGESLTEDEVKEYVLKNMARHKVPSHVRFISSFPMTASGKIQKYKLREMAIESLGLKDAASIETA